MCEATRVCFNVSHSMQGFSWAGQRGDRRVQDWWPKLGGDF